MSDPLRIEDVEQNRYTYADYLEWDDGKRYELIDGTAYMMASPSPEHQSISMELSLQFGNFLRGKPCRVFAAPFDVRLFPKKNKSDKTIVQPDLLIICDKTKLDSGGCKGAPDLVIEILSPSNNKAEMLRKFSKYLMAGVREYWIVDPDKRTVQVNRLNNGTYTTTEYTNDAAVPVSIFTSFSIDLKPVWDALG